MRWCLWSKEPCCLDENLLLILVNRQKEKETVQQKCFLLKMRCESSTIIIFCMYKNASRLLERNREPQWTVLHTTFIILCFNETILLSLPQIRCINANIGIENFDAMAECIFFNGKHHVLAKKYITTHNQREIVGINKAFHVQLVRNGCVYFVCKLREKWPYCDGHSGFECFSEQK